MEFKYLKVLLKKGESAASGAVPDNNGYFAIKNVSAGSYTFFIRQLGFRDAVTDNVVVSDGETTTLYLPYPPPCKLTYEKGQKPKCIGGHADGIIPIVYGLPTKKTMKKAEIGLVHLAGCIVTDCAPNSTARFTTENYKQHLLRLILMLRLRLAPFCNEAATQQKSPP